MCLCIMGRIHIVVDDEIEKEFRNSFDNLKKGDFSKKVEELIKKDLGHQIKGELKLIKKLINDLEKFFLRLYDSEEVSVLAVGKIIKDWEKIKEKHKIFN